MDIFMTLLASLSAGIATTCVILLGMDLMARLEIEKELKAESKSLPLIFKLMLPLVPSVIKLARHTSFDRQRIRSEERLQMAGFDHAINADEFIAVRIMYGIFGALLMILCFFNGHGMVGILVLGLLIIYPGAWLRTQIQKRHTEIMRALPNILDLLTLSVEAGKDFMSALRDILKKRRTDALAEELNRTFSEIQLGKPRAQALKDMSRRVQQSDLTTVLNSIIQAEELGVSIGELLRIQGDLLRNKRFSRAEKLANEAPVKILFPMVLFIFPAVIIILMAPSMMQAMQIIFR